MRRLTSLLVCIASAFAPYAIADQASALAALRSGCADDAQRLCAGVSSGGGRILACLKAHKSELSDRCKQSASLAGTSSDGPNSNPVSVSPPPATPTSGAKGRPSATTTPPPARVQTAAAAKDGAPGTYLRMKQVQIIDQGMDKVQAALPAFDLMIPSAWNFKGNVAFGGGKSGCFADLFAVSWDATSADGSIAFQGAPDYSWQYADDPTVLKKLTDPNRRALGADAKPCTVTKPMKAEEYLRQYVLKVLPSGSTVVSVEPFPELNQIARKRMGLPAESRIEQLYSHRFLS